MSMAIMFGNGSGSGASKLIPSGGTQCNLGYSETVAVAITQMLKRHGKVVSTSEDTFSLLELGPYGFRIEEGRAVGVARHWFHTVEYASSGECGQCLRCRKEDPSLHVVEQTLRNIPYVGSEEAHIAEDMAAQAALRAFVKGSPGAFKMATAVLQSLNTEGTRWYS